jgi:2-dehydropantoate 2-reductase
MMAGTSPFRIAVVGAGAVGGYYGARLAQAGEDVAFLLRGDLAAVREGGWEVESIDGDFELTGVNAFGSSAEIGPVDLVVVAWKSTANHLLGEVVGPLLHEGTCILTLQNGLGNVELLGRLFGAERVLGGLCFVCINRVGPGRLSHTAGGAVSIGEYVGGRRDMLDEVLRRFTGAGIVCKAVDPLGKAQWTKLVWNVPFNGLAIAQGGVTTDVLLAMPGLEAEVRALMVEVMAAAAALGFALDPQLIDRQVALTRGMDAYRPSSMIDYLEGREVETEAIWAEPIRQARAAGVAVPRMEALLERIKARLRER